MWALYCLVRFYNVTHQRLGPIRPLAKFISFKAIVFATWWQGVGIVLLCTFGVLPKEGKFQTGLQDFMICIEVSTTEIRLISVTATSTFSIFQIYSFCTFLFFAACFQSLLKTLIGMQGTLAFLCCWFLKNAACWPFSIKIGGTRNFEGKLDGAFNCLFTFICSILSNF